MKRTLALWLIFLGWTALSAQPFTPDNSVFNPSGIPSLTFSQPRFADLDADGDRDFILGSSNYAPLYIENTGSISAPAFAPDPALLAAIPSLAAEVAVCGDMDADGDLDLVTGGFTGLHLFLNTGSPSNPVFTESLGVFSGLAVGNFPVPDVADIDGDNDLDLVVGLSENGAVLLYENTGTPAPALSARPRSKRSATSDSTPILSFATWTTTATRTSWLDATRTGLFTIKTPAPQAPRSGRKTQPSLAAWA